MHKWRYVFVADCALYHELIFTLNLSNSCTGAGHSNSLGGCNECFRAEIRAQIECIEPADTCNVGFWSSRPQTNGGNQVNFLNFAIITKFFPFNNQVCFYFLVTSMKNSNQKMYNQLNTMSFDMNLIWISIKKQKSFTAF